MSRTQSHETVLEDFEHALLTALGVEESDVPFAAWASAYERLSNEYVETHGSSFAPDPDEMAVRGLAYGSRTLHLALRLLAAYPPPDGPLVELGSGLGPFGFAARTLGRTGSITLVDRSRTLLEVARRLGESRPGWMVTTEESDATAFLRRQLTGETACVALPYSLLELARTTRPLDVVLETARLLRPGGRIYVLEPGDRSSGRSLSTLRAELLEHPARLLRVTAPCTHSAPCPRLTHHGDWCHLTWPLHLGPIGRRVADLARRRHSEVHFSFLILDRLAESAAVSSESPDPSRTQRLLESRRSGPGKRVLRTCGTEGERVLVGLTRDRTLEAYLGQVLPGAVVTLDESKLTPKGDGERMSNSAALRVIREF
ncbi:MAG: hypothetical protein HY791_17265 [Deltaproteobacteria bacterium]|nr:hypothetical protein [Deltaproteobacteria bacterium]